jgi:hypothetical protein
VGPALPRRGRSRPEAGERNRHATVRRTGQCRGDYEPRLGTAFAHTVTDYHSRVAYAEIHDDETAITATAVLRQAVAPVSRARRHHPPSAVGQRPGLQISAPDRYLHRAEHHGEEDPTVPTTDERQNRTFPSHLADSWTLAKLYTSEKARRAALPAFLHHYNPPQTPHRNR